MKGTSKISLTIGIAICCSAVAAMLLNLTASFAVRIPQQRFDSKLWLAWKDDEKLNAGGSIRQKMIEDLVIRVLPGRDKESIVEVLGASPTHLEWRTHNIDNLTSPRRAPDGGYERTGKGFYLEKFGWDLIYPIGDEQVFLWDHNGNFMEEESEYLLLRLDGNGKFESWFVVGASRWEYIGGRESAKNYRKLR